MTAAAVSSRIKKRNKSPKKQQKVIVVEGPMDLFAFDRAGISNVVATLGTACTKEQMLLLRKLSMNIVLCPSYG